MKPFRHAILNELSLGGGYRAIREEPLDLDQLPQAAKVVHPDNVRDVIAEIGPLFFCFRNPSSIDIVCMQVIIRGMQSGLLVSHLEFLSTPPSVEQLASRGEQWEAASWNPGNTRE